MSGFLPNAVLLNAFALLLLAACGGGSGGGAAHRAGTLDDSFGAGGRVVTDFGSNTTDAGYAMAVQPGDGKLVVVGQGYGTDYDFGVVRYTTEGILDPAFSSDGKAEANFGASDTAYGVAVQPTDGKLVVVGEVRIGANTDFGLVRFDTDGQLDVTFGINGRTWTDMASGQDVASAVAVQGDQKILVAGSAVSGGSTTLAVARYESDGQLDTTFNTTGKVLTDVSFLEHGAAGTSRALAIAIQSDGRILVAGSSVHSGHTEMALARYTPAGALDASFGGNGIVTHQIADHAWAYDLAIQADGKVVVAGHVDMTSAPTARIALVRYLDNGTLDPTFGSSGVVTTVIGSGAEAQGLALQADGKIVVAGGASDGSHDNFAFARYTPSGLLDPAFGSGGIFTTPIGSGGSIAHDVGIQADGRILAVGKAEGGATTSPSSGSGLRNTSGHRDLWHPSPPGDSLLGGRSLQEKLVPEGQARIESQGALCRTFEDEALAAERTFAARAAHEGIREAFLAVLAEDSRVLGEEGPELGRPAYEALPRAAAGLLQWEPALVGAAWDGTLAFTAGPYRLLDPAGHERSTGVYFSVWRRQAVSGVLELVLDFGSKGSTFAGDPEAPGRLRTSAAPAEAATMEAFLRLCLARGSCPSLAAALRLGDPPPDSPPRPLGYHVSSDGTLGVLWGATARLDGSNGAFGIVLGTGPRGPEALVASNI